MPPVAAAPATGTALRVGLAAGRGPGEDGVRSAGAVTRGRDRTVTDRREGAAVALRAGEAVCEGGAEVGEGSAGDAPSGPSERPGRRSPLRPSRRRSQHRAAAVAASSREAHDARTRVPTAAGITSSRAHHASRRRLSRGDRPLVSFSTVSRIGSRTPVDVLTRRWRRS